MPRHLLMQYYKSNVQPIIQYGILVYGCCSFSSLKPILTLQKKILKFIYFRKKDDHSEDIFLENSILTVYELHIYELIKFVLKSIHKLHAEDFLNNLFQFEKNKKTRRGNMELLIEPLCKRKIQMFSVYFRGAKLYNALQKQGLLPSPSIQKTVKEVMNDYHKLKEQYILNNGELVRHIFMSN